MEFFKKLTI